MIVFDIYIINTLLNNLNNIIFVAQKQSFIGLKYENIEISNFRLRRIASMAGPRRLVAENNLTANDLIIPIFIREGKKQN